MDLITLIKTARGRYGVSRLGAGDDELFNHVLMLDLVNDAHRALAELTRCYRQEQTYDLPLGVNGVSSVPLLCNVIDLHVERIRVTYGGSWREIAYQPESYVLSLYGLPENRTNAGPLVGYTRLGDTLEGQRVLDLVPGSDAAVTGGVKVTADIYPALLTADTDTPALQPAEHQRLIPLICLRMAELDTARGNLKAPLMYWSQEAAKSVRELRRIHDRFRNGGVRQVRHRPEDYHY